MAWEKYYSALQKMPRRMKTNVDFVVKEVPNFKHQKIKKILDLGCGPGRPSIYLAKNGFDVVGLDLSQSALRMASAWAHKEKLRNIRLIRGTMTHLPFRNGVFDAVVSVSTIIHTVKSEIARAVGEIHRILRKDGLLLANLTSTKDPRCGKGERVENGTFRIMECFENKRFEELHHFFTEKETYETLKCFSEASVELLNDQPYYWKAKAVK